MKGYMNMVRASVLSVLLAAGATASAAAPELINFQGRVSDAAGVPLSGQYGVTFSVYDAQLGGNLLWSEHRGAVDVNRGLFSVPLGELAAQAPSTVFTGGDQWLEVQLDGDTPMVPRQRIGSVAYSFHANVADEVVNELDPTVAAEVKDGVVWSEVGEIPAGFADGVDDVGLTAELDPTVPESLKDGVAWGEVANIPAGFADGVDDVGLTAESDPQVGAVGDGQWCRGSGGQVSCDQPAPTDADTLGGLNCAVDQIARYDGSAWVCADSAGGGSAGVPSVAAKATLSSTQRISGSTNTLVRFNVKVHGDAGDFDTGRHAFVAPVSGVYHANFGVRLDNAQPVGGMGMRIFRNSELVAITGAQNRNDHVSNVLSSDIHMEAGDSLTFYVKYNWTSANIRPGQEFTWASAHLVKPSATN